MVLAVLAARCSPLLCAVCVSLWSRHSCWTERRLCARPGSHAGNLKIVGRRKWCLALGLGSKNGSGTQQLSHGLHTQRSQSHCSSAERGACWHTSSHTCRSHSDSHGVKVFIIYHLQSTMGRDRHVPSCVWTFGKEKVKLLGGGKNHKWSEWALVVMI